MRTFTRGKPHGNDDQKKSAGYLISATLLDFAPKKQLENWGYVKVLPKLASLSKFVFNQENKFLMEI